jgi:Zn-dependent M32 family carboxypeptidase
MYAYTHCCMQIFDELRAGLAPLLQSIIDKQKQINSNSNSNNSSNSSNSAAKVKAALQSGPQWDVQQQKKLCSVVAEQLGFSMANGRYVTLFTVTLSAVTHSTVILVVGYRVTLL